MAVASVQTYVDMHNSQHAIAIRASIICSAVRGVAMPGRALQG